MGEYGSDAEVLAQMGTDWQSMGPQIDGTYNMPASAGAVQPLDAAGGAPANYGSDIKDLFKFGVGVWAQQQSQQNMLDYKRYEATNGGLFRQGQPALFQRTATGQNTPTLWLFGAGLLAFLLLTKKG